MRYRGKVVKEPIIRRKSTLQKNRREVTQGPLLKGKVHCRELGAGLQAKARLKKGAKAQRAKDSIIMWKSIFQRIWSVCGGVVTKARLKTVWLAGACSCVWDGLFLSRGGNTWSTPVIDKGAITLSLQTEHVLCSLIVNYKQIDPSPLHLSFSLTVLHLKVISIGFVVLSSLIPSTAAIFLTSYNFSISPPPPSELSMKIRILIEFIGTH